MIKNNQVAQLMSKEMDRKEFLKYGGGVLLAVIGVTGLLNTIFRLSNSQSEGGRSGYGSSSYGR